MAQAYYHLDRPIIAKEHFDSARDLDPQYVLEDPTLLFHMGETYYENADFMTAREAFRALLERYPKQDFTKLVALRLGDFLRDEGKEEQAIRAYEKAINSYSREIVLLGKLRIANIQATRPYSDEYLEAIDLYDEIVRLLSETNGAPMKIMRRKKDIQATREQRAQQQNMQAALQAAPQTADAALKVAQISQMAQE